MCSSYQTYKHNNLGKKYFKKYIKLKSKLTSNGVIGRGQRGQCVHIPEKDLSVQSCRSHQLFVFSICQCFNIVLQKYQQNKNTQETIKHRNTHNAHFNIEKHKNIYSIGRFILETLCIKLKTHGLQTHAEQQNKGSTHCLSTMFFEDFLKCFLKAFLDVFGHAPSLFGCASCNILCHQAD